MGDGGESMDFWSRNVENSFDEMFDLNRDGKLDFGEQAFQQDFITRDIESNNGSNDEDDDLDELDLDDLELMDEDERREALEDAGYDPDDFEDEF